MRNAYPGVKGGPGTRFPFRAFCHSADTPGDNLTWCSAQIVFTLAGGEPNRGPAVPGQGHDARAGWQFRGDVNVTRFYPISRTRKEETHEDDASPGADAWVPGACQPERQAAFPRQVRWLVARQLPRPSWPADALAAPTAAELLVTAEMDLTPRTGTGD